MNIKEGLDWGIRELKKSDVSEPESSASLLLANVLKKDKAFLYAHGEKNLTKAQEKKYKSFIARRKKHEPVWYIVGEVEFYGRKFFINKDVLTPRPETEFLIKEILSANSQQPTAKSIVETGTGSGVIAVTLEKELKNTHNVIPAETGIQGTNKNSWIPRSSPRMISGRKGMVKIIATDISKKALNVAKRNAKKHGALKNIKFLKSDLLEAISPNYELRTTNNILIANLPYIPHEEMKNLPLDVKQYEPRGALDGGKEGLEVYERLIKQMKELNFTGKAFFEIGIGQKAKLRKMINKCLPKAKVVMKKDLANIDRIALLELK